VRAAVLADVEERANARVAEHRDRARPDLEAGAQLAALGVLADQHLDRDGAADARVARTVHLAHAARPEAIEHLIAARRPAGKTRHDDPTNRETGDVVPLPKSRVAFAIVWHARSG
jgi:hypothetical protein